MAIPFLSKINMNQNEIQNLVLHSQNSDPSGTEGQIYYNSTSNKVLIHNGSNFVPISGDITEVIAGNGLTGGGTIDAVTLNVVGGTGITVNANNIEITAGGIGSTSLATGAVTTVKLAADAVTGAKIADDAVDSEHIAAGAVDTEHIADSQVTTAKIANDAITGDKLANSITIAQDLTVTGDLTVSGDTISANVGTLDVEDKNITVNKSSGDSSSTADGAGLTIQDAVNASTDATMLWSASNDNFVFSHEVAAPSLDISGNVDVDGTMEADAITVNGTALKTVIDGRVTAREFKDDVPSAAKTAGTAFTVDHNLNSRDIIIQVYNNVTNIDGDGSNTNEIDNQYETVNVEVYRNTVNQITIKSGVALAADSLRVLITKIG